MLKTEKLLVKVALWLKKKPTLIDHYNKLMGGVDTKDKSIYHLSCTRCTRRYWEKFSSIFWTCVYTVPILYTVSNAKKKVYFADCSLLSRHWSFSCSSTFTLSPGCNQKLKHLLGEKTRVCCVCPPEIKKRSS
ncbi:hypothetical protein J6590_086318 [Homalodisca vitripennis]|nr:hypothetical protein J6590_086318 [Homalodisca vitripennis]